ncbi:MAG TPA: DegQ family serine endoprotease [Casimicrobiaceae bacterium]|nr:DegQ family serine endoprotease [Casimicrobiaceae bacterium]
MQTKTFRRTAVAIAVAGAFTIGVVSADRIGFHHANAAVATAPTPVAAAAASTTAALPDFSGLVEQYGAAVVNISVVSDGRKVASRDQDQDEDSPGLNELPPQLRNFPFFHNLPMPQIPRGPMRGVGSGFIVSGDGVILTNAHVVDDADEVTVKLTDRREFKAKVLGSDRTTDIAVLKIDAKNLPTVKIGSPDSTKVGEWVVAIGQPFGFENTVTSGIVSAKARALPQDSYVRFIQTDAAVNPGNSGGPLFNMRGEVIGVNSQIFSRSGGFQGLAFAIPIDVAMQVKDEIQQHGKVSHGKLGITIQEVSQGLADNFGLKTPAGALVSSVQKDGPGAKAGLEPGDVILKFNGKEITRSSDLPPLVATMKPGATATLEIWRDGKAKELTATVGQLDDGRVASAGKAEASKGKLGVAVRPLSPEEKRGGDLENGVVVQDVAGAAAKAGVRAGDVIVAVNNTPVKSPEQLRELIAKAGKTIALLVQREDARIFIPVTLG